MPSQVGEVAAVLERMNALLAKLQPANDPRQYFLAVYRRMTLAVDARLTTGFFVDPTWVEAWDVAFADLYLAALEADEPSDPWVAAFAAPGSMPTLRHVLLGMNAHINYDLPQSLLAVIDDDQARDGALMARRRIDHMRVNQIITSRVRDEDAEMAAAGVRSAVDRFLAPLNRIASRRFLTEARRKVWTNTLDLAAARRYGSDSYAAWLERLSTLSEQRVRDLTAPGLVLLRLGRSGFGVLLRPAEPMRSFDPVVLGVAERDAWATYYRRDWPAFLRAAWRLTREAFGMSLPRTALGAWWVLLANRAWAPYPDNDPDAARALMQSFYTLVNQAHGLDLDVEEAARREVAWWRAHRDAQYSTVDGYAPLVTALIDLYAHVYDVAPASVEHAAQLRTAAMEVSDTWVASGCPEDADRLDRIRDLLVDSYSELLLAVRRPLPLLP